VEKEFFFLVEKEFFFLAEKEFFFLVEKEFFAAEKVLQDIYFLLCLLLLHYF
jgi:hypothetical protein